MSVSNSTFLQNWTDLELVLWEAEPKRSWRGDFCRGRPMERCEAAGVYFGREYLDSWGFTGWELDWISILPIAPKKQVACIEKVSRYESRELPSSPRLTLILPEELQLYGLYVHYVVHICDFGMLRVKQL